MSLDANTILKVIQTLIGETEPCGDSVTDGERMENLIKLIYVVDELLYDVEKVAINKDRHEGSMCAMGKKAHEALNYWRCWIERYIEAGDAEWR